MFAQQTGTWVDYLPIILLITSSVGALLPTGILLWAIREISSTKKDVARVELKTALNSENIEDLEIRVQKVHDRNHDLSNDYHGIQLKLAQNGFD